VAVTIQPARPGDLPPILLEAYGFTDRELQIVVMLARGLATKQIARQLYLAPHTARDHLKAIFDKAGVNSRGELVGKLFSEHLLESMTADIAHAPVAAAADFGDFEGRAWLNCAHQGPLPRVAVAAAEGALADKAAPHRIGDASFTEVPGRLRAALGRLVGVPADQLILGNSTSYGLQLLVQGIDWRRGDEVLLVDGDFPATIVPWLPLAERGVRVRLLRPGGGALEAGQLEAELTPATRLFCSSWVFSFTGQQVDLAALGGVCRRAGVRFVVNGSQAVGAAPLDLGTLAVDGLVSCGFKWLCGPYATGFCWLRPDLAASLRNRPAYWLSHSTQEDLGQAGASRLRDELGAAAWDVFGTANFLNFRPWTASVEYLLGLGIERVAAWDQALVERFLQGLDPDRYQLVSPRQGSRRSTLVVFGHRQADQTGALFERLTAAGVDVALRRGQLRVSPHLYNTEADIDRALEILDGPPGGRP
jgi:selenocysteine lyase/cysteine desulfurase/DNA-binding CsgD family transcriptional regulator